jgi:phosphate transport system substrate-binding protein
MKTKKWTWRAFTSTTLTALIAITSSIAMQAANALDLNGAGATFPEPLYTKWFFEYNKKNPAVKINYQAIGSGGGINQITKKTVDFGASDAAMTDEELSKAPSKILMLPVTAGAVVVTYNLPGAPNGLKLDREALAAIYQGKVNKWNDPKITKNNPGVKLPDQSISVVRRADGSGTSFIFTSHLAAISPEWKRDVGSGKNVKWPVGIGAKGNDGVAAQVQQTPGAIGYIEYAYATENKLPVATLQNLGGKFVPPSIEGVSAALEGTKYPSNLRVFIADPDGPSSYPIVGLTWMLVYEKMEDKAKAAELAKFINWALTDGQQYAKPLKYAPLPPNLVKLVKQSVAQVK